MCTGKKSQNFYKILNCLLLYLVCSYKPVAVIEEQDAFEIKKNDIEGIVDKGLLGRCSIS